MGPRGAWGLRGRPRGRATRARGRARAARQGRTGLSRRDDTRWEVFGRPWARETDFITQTRSFLCTHSERGSWQRAPRPSSGARRRRRRRMRRTRTRRDTGTPWRGARATWRRDRASGSARPWKRRRSPTADGRDAPGVRGRLEWRGVGEVGESTSSLDDPNHRASPTQPHRLAVHMKQSTLSHSQGRARPGSVARRPRTDARRVGFGHERSSEPNGGSTRSPPAATSACEPASSSTRRPSCMESARFTSASGDKRVGEWNAQTTLIALPRSPSIYHPLSFRLDRAHPSGRERTISSSRRQEVRRASITSPGTGLGAAGSGRPGVPIADTAAASRTSVSRPASPSSGSGTCTSACTATGARMPWVCARVIGWEQEAAESSD